MKIVELNQSHYEKTTHLFQTKNFMGTDTETNYFVPTDNNPMGKIYHRAFGRTYLTGLSRYKALGLEDDEGNILGYISFYLSPNEPVWYGTMIRSAHNKEYVRQLLEAAMEYNEKLGRYRFYTLWSAKHAKLLRRFAFSGKANERYDYFDECLVPAKTKCIHQNFWTILFSRILLPTDTVVRCTYLKREHRPETPIGGFL
jgi:hypothetical protein